MDEDRKTFRTYLRAALGEDYQAEKIEAFLEAAPRMVEFFHEHTELRFVPGAKIRDIYGKLPGAGTGHRSVGPAPYDAREIRPELLQKLRRQLYATSFLGMGILAGPDLTKFLSASQGSPSGLLHATRRVSRHMFDLALHRRGLQLVNGTALIGRLARSADDLGVELRVRTEAVELTVDDDGRITGAIVEGPDGRREIRARRGVVLAAGGFPRNMRMRAELFPRTEHGRDHWTLAPGAVRRRRDPSGHARGRPPAHRPGIRGHLVPRVLGPYPGGRTGTFPHIMDRAKPGSIGVLSTGKRFVNEANGYYDYVDARISSAPEGEPVQSWQIADSRFVRRYPLGMAKPLPVPLTPYLRSGYLKKGSTIEELAEKCGIDPQQLRATVERFNENARRGEDPDFHRGETEFNRYGGDPKVEPNPSLAPLEKGPF